MEFNFFNQTSSLKTNCSNLIKKYSSYASKNGLASSIIDDDIETIVESFEFKKSIFSKNVLSFLKTSQAQAQDENESKPNTPSESTTPSNTKNSKEDTGSYLTPGQKSLAQAIGSALAWSGYSTSNSGQVDPVFSNIWDLSQKYIQGSLSTQHLINSSPFFSRAYQNKSNEKISPMWYWMDYLRNQTMSRSSGSGSLEETRENMLRQLEAINYWRREKGLPEYKTLEEAKRDQEKQKRDLASLESKMIEAIADGDLDALMVLNPTYEQYSGLINKIITRAPRSKNFYNQEHFENGVSEYLISKYGISPNRSEAVYRNIFTKIIQNDQWTSGLAERKQKEKEQRESQSHERAMRNLNRNQQREEARGRLEGANRLRRKIRRTR
jgi:hypothetical protein